MGTGFRGAVMIAWAQTEIEGFPAETQQELAEGMTWAWRGRALPLDGDGAALILTASRDLDDIRSRAARTVCKMLHRPAPGPADHMRDDDDDLMRGSFVVSDGTRFFTVVPITIEAGADPVLMFPDSAPPEGKVLTIVHCADRALRRAPAEPPTVICFTPGTRLRTETGETAIEDLSPGDRILTRDSGPQEVLWSGHRRMSGARLFAMPDQRPIRLRKGALGIDRPDADLVVSPEHRVLVKGRAAQDLWGEPEVLVRAADLVGDRFITVDHSLRETFYVHLLLERHQVIWANGLEVETFHPGFMGLDTLDRLQRDSLFDLRPDLARNPHHYGPAARRMVSQAEAAILRHGTGAPL
jgi:hypothetical protein